MCPYVRAIGPDLADAGIQIPLADPTLELHNAAGDLIAINDDWRSSQESDIIATGLSPQNDRDSAIVATLIPSLYTSIVRGKNSTTGVGLVEFYRLN